MAGLQRIDRTVMLADRVLRCAHQPFSQFGADEVAAVIAQLRQTPGIGTREGLRRGVFGEQRGGQRAVEAADMAGEFGEAEIDQAVELADPVVEVLAQPIAVADEFAQALGVAIVARTGGVSESLCI